MVQVYLTLKPSAIELYRTHFWTLKAAGDGVRGGVGGVMSDQRLPQIMAYGGQQTETPVVGPLQCDSPDDLEMRLFNQNSNIPGQPLPLNNPQSLHMPQMWDLGAAALPCTLVSERRSRPALWLRRGAMLGVNQ